MSTIEEMEREAQNVEQEIEQLSNKLKAIRVTIAEEKEREETIHKDAMEAKDTEHLETNTEIQQILHRIEILEKMYEELRQKETRLQHNIDELQSS